MSTEPRSPAISKAALGPVNIDTLAMLLGAAAGFVTLLSSGPEIWANFNDIARAAEQSIYRNALQATGNSLWLAFGIIQTVRNRSEKSSFRTLIATASLGVAAATTLIIQCLMAQGL